MLKRSECVVFLISLLLLAAAVFTFFVVAMVAVAQLTEWLE